jgi:dipeptidyl aminopeptidase/acylaminoacyl peptidase
MKLALRLIGVLPVVFFLVLFGCGEKKNQLGQIPIEDFFRNPEKTQFQISPSGEHISFLQPYQNRLNIVVEELATGKMTSITQIIENNVSKYFWANDDKLIFFSQRDDSPNYGMFSVNRDGSDQKEITPNPQAYIRLMDELQNNPDEILIGMNIRDKAIFDVYRMNINSGETKIVAENPGNIAYFKTDHEGKVRVAIATDGVNESLLHRKDENSPFEVVTTTNFKITMFPLFFTFDNKSIYACSNVGRDKCAIVTLDLSTGEEIDTIFSHPEVDVMGLKYSKARKKLLYAGYSTWKSEAHFLDENAKIFREKLKNKIGDIDIEFVGTDRQERKLLFRTYDDISMGAYYLYDFNIDSLTLLSEVSPWLNPKEMAKMKPVKYKTRDGFIVHGYLSTPVGKEAKKLPTVVIPHSGLFTGRTHWGFNPEVQFLANRGYAVLIINNRGTIGYGRKFWEASFKQWGGAVQNDITDGVKWLTQEGISDPAKIAIYGKNFSGFSALQGLAMTPDLYSCAINYSGPINLFTYMREMPAYWQPYLEMMYEIVGHPEKDATLFKEISPIFLTEKINKPVMIVMGEKDPHASVTEVNRFVKNLLKRDIPVTYIVKKDEGRSFQKEENKIELYQAMETFLETNLPR